MKSVYLAVILLTTLSCSRTDVSKERHASTSAEDERNVDTVSAGDRTVVNLVYHRFDDNDHPSTSISSANFKRHLQYLKARHFTVMTFSDAVHYLKTGTAENKVAVITVDDGFKSFMEVAMPLLEEFNFPATLFINTETVGTGSYLGWSDLRLLKNKGIEIGNHSHTHKYFMDLPEQERAKIFKDDVRKAQQAIKKHLNFVPEVFAFPYGEFDPEMKKVIESLGFIAAAAQCSGVMYTQGDYFAIPRFPMNDLYAASFIEKIKMKPLKVSASPSSTLPGEINPPELQLLIETDSLSVHQLQCFVQGSACALEIIQEKPLKIKIRSTAPLKHRRTLYTVTVPSTSGEWHWYSHLWIRPNAD